MRTLIYAIALLLCGLALWKWFETRDPGQSIFAGDTVVIEFTDGQDLLAQLKQVEAGQKIEIIHKPSAEPEQTVSTGISCGDTEAKAAYMAQVNKELEELNNAINAELDRIHQVQ